jgi:hypothetical protein
VLTGSIPKGTPVYLAGYDNDLLVVEACDAANAAEMPCIGVTAEALDDTNAKKVVSFGKIQGVDTSLWADGTELYVAVGGGFTTTRPTGTAEIQRVAVVLKGLDAAGGSIKVFNTSRTNGHPQAEPLCPFLLTDIFATDTITACRWNGSSFDRYAISGQKFLDLATNVEDEGTPLPKRPTLNFTGAGVTVTDDAGGNETVVTISSTGGSAGTADSSGVLTGGVLSVGTGGPGVATTFSISDGTGQIVDATGAKTPVSWSGLTDQALTFLATNLISFIAIDSGGSVIQSTTKFTPQQSRQYIVLGVIVHVNFTTVDTVNNEQNIAYNVMSSVYDGFESLGFFNVSGNVFSANGANMNINKSSGVMFKMGSNYDTDINNPHRRTLAALTPAQFQYRFSDGTSGILTETNIDPNNLDDGAGGLTAISANRWSVQRIYSFTSNNVKIQRGVAEYATSDAAISGITTEAYVTEPSIAANGLFRGWLIVKQGATALNGSDAIFLSAGKLGEQGISGGGAGAGATDLQTAYDNSTANPEILTNSTNGAHTVRRGSAADTDNIYEGQNNAGTTNFAVTGEGKVSAIDFNGVALTTGGVTTKYLDEQGNYTTPGGGGTSKFNHTTYAFDFVGASGTWNGNAIGAVGSTEYDDRWRVVSFAGTGQPDGFYINFRLSSEYTAGTDIRVEFDFATLVGSGGGNAHFGVGLCEPETVNNSFGSEATTTYITQDIAVQPGDRIATYSAVFSGTNLEPGDQLSIMVYRDPGNVGNTNNETLYVSTIIAEEV